MVRLYEVRPAICDEFLDLLSNNESIDVNSIYPDLRRHAHRQKLNRELYEKYGDYKNIILDPRFQLVKSYLEENLDLDFVGEPLLPFSTAVIVLFMISGRLSKSSTILAALFIFNMNPIYVTIGMLLWWLRYSPSRKPKQFKSVKVLPKGVKQELHNTYDHILLGCDIGTLYTAALLSKCGHSCCVADLQCTDKLDVHPEGFPCAAPLYQCTMTNPERYQTLLDAALGADTKTRIPIVPIGEGNNGFINGTVAMKGISSSPSRVVHPHKQTIVYSRPGEEMFLRDSSYILREEKSILRNVWQDIKTGIQHITSYFIQKCIPETKWKESTLSSMNDVKQCEEFLEHSMEEITNRHGFTSMFVKHYLHMLSCTVGAGEALPMHRLSSTSLANVVAGVEHGRFVPVGGVSAVKQALIDIIERHGGHILSIPSTVHLELEQNDERYKAIGITVSKSNKEKGVKEEEEDTTIHATQSVISGLGVLATYSNLLPTSCIHPATKGKLSGLQERRPKIRVIFWLSGTKESLELSSAEYFEIQRQEIDEKEKKEEEVSNEQQQKEEEALAKSFVHVWSPSAQDPSWHASNTSILIVEWEATQPDVQPQKWDLTSLSSTSASASSPAESTEESSFSSPVFFMNSHNPESSPNHDNFTDQVGRKWVLSENARQRYIVMSRKIVTKLYPTVENDLKRVHVETTTLGGHHLANDCKKMASKIGAFTEVENLFLTGSDLGTGGFMGDLQSGWITANAVLGYDLNDLQNSRNVVADLLMHRN